jgi:hypothetical protein
MGLKIKSKRPRWVPMMGRISEVSRRASEDHAERWRATACDLTHRFDGVRADRDDALPSALDAGILTTHMLQRTCASLPGHILPSTPLCRRN